MTDFIFERLKNSSFIGLMVVLLATVIQLHAQPSAIETGAMQLEAYLPIIKGKRVGLVVNPTATIGKTHLVDTLSRLGVQISAVLHQNMVLGEKQKQGLPSPTAKTLKLEYG